MVFTLKPGDGAAANQGTNQTNLNDFGPGAFNPVTVVIPAGQTTANFTVTPLQDGQTELAEGFSVEAVVAGETFTANATVLDGQAGGGKTFVLTAGVDVFTPTAEGSSQTTSGNDTFIATGATFSGLDQINGGGGVNSLIIRDDSGVMNKAVPNGITLTNIQKMEIETTGDLGASLQARTITIDADADGEVTVNYGTQSATVDLEGTDDLATRVEKIANAINAMAGETVATANEDLNGTVAVKATSEASTLPVISFAGVNTAAITDNTASTIAGTAYDVSQFATVEEFKISKANSANVKVGADTDAVISGIDSSISIEGGKTQTFDLTKGAVTATKSVGTVDVTHSNQTAAIAIENGTDVTVEATVSNNTTTVKNGAAITVGATDQTASGDVSITKNLTSDGQAAMAGGATTVVGGKNVEVTINATSNAKAHNTSNDITLGNVTVTSDKTTETVTVTQSKNVTQVTKAAVNATAGTTELTFKAMTKDQTLTVNGLTFTATKNLTKEQVAQAFSNLTSTDRQDAGGPTANGFYTGAVDGTVYSGAANGDKVVFTNALAVNTANNAHQAPTMTIAGTAAAPTEGATAGTAFAAQDKSANNIGYGNVVIDEVSDTASEKSITTITLDGYDDATLGGDSAIKSLDKLTTLSLANSEGEGELRTEQRALDLTVNNITGSLNLDEGGATITNLNLTVAGTNPATGIWNSSFGLTAINVVNLDVNAGANVRITGDSIGSGNSLETVKISGAGRVDLGGNATSTSLKSFDASGNTGGITSTINANATTLTAFDKDAGYLFSAGNDVVTLANTTVSLDIHLGAGDDKITLATGTEALAADIDGGTGVNTIAMAAADAASVSGSNQFQGKIDNFQKLEVGSVAEAETATINMTNMDGIAHVITHNAAAGGTQEVQTFTVATGVTTTKTNAIQTIDFGTANASGDGTFQLGGVSIDVLEEDGGQAIANKVAAALNGATVNGHLVAAAVVMVPDPVDPGVAPDVPTPEVRITYPTTAGQPSQLTFASGSAAWTQQPPETTTTHTAFAEDDQTLPIDGVNVTLEAPHALAATPTTVVAGTGDDTAEKVAAKIATQMGDDATFNAAGTSNDGAVVTVTYEANGPYGAIATGAGSGVTFGAANATVTTPGVAGVAAGVLTFDNFADNGTVEIVEAGAGLTVNVKDAGLAGQDSNVLNVITGISSANEDLNLGTLTVNKVETINIETKQNYDTEGKSTNNTQTLTVAADSAETINVEGAGHLVLTVTDATGLEAVNATAMTGNLTFSSGKADVVITGGSGHDTITITGGGDNAKVNGGAGNDTLIVTGGATYVELTGGAGRDTFNVSGFTAKARGDAPFITDIESYETIIFSTAGTPVFIPSKVVIDPNAGFESAIDTALAAAWDLNDSAGNIAWFQYGTGENAATYIVQDLGTKGFVADQDIIVKLAGTIDLSEASFNQTIASLEMGIIA